MPFEKRTVMEQKLGFIEQAGQISMAFCELCRQYGISRPTGYKWMHRYKQGGMKGLEELCRRPKQSPGKTLDEVEELLVALRQEDPEWGPKKLYRLLVAMRAMGKYPFDHIPVPSTIGSILKRRGLITDEKSQKVKAYQRFEYSFPNELWQMDYKGEFRLDNGMNCYPLTVTDDHSRFNIVLKACRDQRHFTVQQQLTQAFREYGLPQMMLSDNGPPWGTTGETLDDEDPRSITKVEKWLIRLKIKLIHGRAYHPQTQGKEERFHRTLKNELLNHTSFLDFTDCQFGFDKWREKYNFIRPHEALGFNTPAQRYVPSDRSFPERLPDLEYLQGDILVKSDQDGRIYFKKRKFKIGRAFTNDQLALRPGDHDGCYKVYYGDLWIKTIHL